MTADRLKQLVRVIQLAVTDQNTSDSFERVLMFWGCRERITEEEATELAGLTVLEIAEQIARG